MDAYQILNQLIHPATAVTGSYAVALWASHVLDSLVGPPEWRRALEALLARLTVDDLDVVTTGTTKYFVGRDTEYAPESIDRFQRVQNRPCKNGSTYRWTGEDPEGCPEGFAFRSFDLIYCDGSLEYATLYNLPIIHPSELLHHYDDLVVEVPTTAKEVQYAVKFDIMTMIMEAMSRALPDLNVQFHESTPETRGIVPARTFSPVRPLVLSNTEDEGTSFGFGFDTSGSFLDSDFGDDVRRQLF